MSWHTWCRNKHLMIYLMFKMCEMMFFSPSTETKNQLEIFVSCWTGKWQLTLQPVTNFRQKDIIAVSMLFYSVATNYIVQNPYWME